MSALQKALANNNQHVEQYVKEQTRVHANAGKVKNEDRALRIEDGRRFSKIRNPHFRN